MLRYIVSRTLKTRFEARARPPTTRPRLTTFHFKDGTKNYWIHGRWLDNSS